MTASPKQGKQETDHAGIMFEEGAPGVLVMKRE